MLGGGRQGVGQEVDRDPEFIMRAGEILRLKSELAALQGRLPLHDAGLAPRDLVLRDAAHILRGGGRAKHDEEKGEKEERTGVGFGVHGGELRSFAMLRLQDADFDFVVRLLGVDDNGLVRLDHKELIPDLRQRFQ